MTARAIAALRHLAAFAVAPAVAPVAALGYEAFRMCAPVGATGAPMVAFTASPLDLAVTFATAWVPAAYAVAIVLGVPTVLALRAARRLTVPWVVGSSVAAASATVAVGVAIGMRSAGAEVALEHLADAALLAGIAAALAASVSAAYCAVAGVSVGRRAAPGAGPRLT